MNLIEKGSLFLFIGSLLTMMARVSSEVQFIQRLDEMTHGNSTYITSDGGYVVAGTLFSNSLDLLITKWDSTGNFTWARTFGGNTTDEVARSIQQTTDNGYIVVGDTSISDVSSQLLITKWNSDGVLSWARTYGDTDKQELGYDVKQTNDGGYIVLGSVTQFGPFATHILLTKWDSSGSIEWARTLGNDSTYTEGFSIQKTSDGYIVTGLVESEPVLEDDLLLVKLDPNGVPTWVRSFGTSTSDEVGFSVQQTIDNGYVVVGRTLESSNDDLLITKWASNGNLIWAKNFGTPDKDEYGYDIKQTGDGGYIIVGSTGEPFMDDILILKCDSGGSLSWAKTFLNTRYESGHSVQLTGDGGFAVAGSYADRDLFLSKFDESASSGCLINFDELASLTLSLGGSTITLNHSLESDSYDTLSLTAMPFTPTVTTECLSFSNGSNLLFLSSSLLLLLSMILFSS